MEPGSTTQRRRHSFPLLERILLFFIFVVTCSISFAQDGQSITQLLSLRNERITQQLETREIDQQLFTLGYRPKAVITSEALENGQLRITFPTYQPIPDAKKARIEERLGQHYGAYLLSINVEPQLQKVTLLVPATTTSEQLDALFDHFGYLGHE